jgi:hypothetical protein
MAWKEASATCYGVNLAGGSQVFLRAVLGLETVLEELKSGISCIGSTEYELTLLAMG